MSSGDNVFGQQELLDNDGPVPVIPLSDVDKMVRVIKDRQKHPKGHAFHSCVLIDAVAFTDVASELRPTLVAQAILREGFQLRVEHESLVIMNTLPRVDEAAQAGFNPDSPEDQLASRWAARELLPEAIRASEGDPVWPGVHPSHRVFNLASDAQKAEVMLKSFDWDNKAYWTDSKLDDVLTIEKRRLTALNELGSLLLRMEPDPIDIEDVS